jgi:hypothetical protein
LTAGPIATRGSQRRSWFFACLVPQGNTFVCHRPRPRTRRAVYAPGTRLLIAELFEANREQINAVFERTLDVIEAVLQAQDTLLVTGALVAGARSLRLGARKLALHDFFARVTGGSASGS